MSEQEYESDVFETGALQDENATEEDVLLVADGEDPSTEEDPDAPQDPVEDERC